MKTDVHALLPNSAVKKSALTLLLLITWASAQAQAWDKTYFTPSQPSPQVSMKIGYNKFATVGGQMFSCTIQNLTQQQLTVSLDLIATTVCGTQVRKHIALELKPNEKGGNGSVLQDDYVGFVKSTDCAGVKFQLYDPTNRVEITETNRIADVGYQNFRLQATPVAGSTTAKTATATSANGAGNSYHTSTAYSTPAVSRTPAPMLTPQQQQYQQQANAHLADAAQDASNPIKQAYDLSAARMKATASGNQAQAQQIAQQQNQIQTQANTEITGQLADLLTRPRPRPAYSSYSVPSTPYDPESSSSWHDAGIQWGQREDEGIIQMAQLRTISETGPHDRYFNKLAPGDPVVNNEKQNMTPDEMYRAGCFENTSYHNYRRAMSWFTKSAEGGCLEAMRRLGNEYGAKGNYSEAYFDKAVFWSKHVIAYIPNGQDTKLRESAIFNFTDLILYYKPSNFAEATRYLLELDTALPSCWARKAIAEMNKKGDTTMPANPSVVLEWYERALAATESPDFHHLIKVHIKEWKKHNK